MLPSYLRALDPDPERSGSMAWADCWLTEFLAVLSLQFTKFLSVSHSLCRFNVSVQRYRLIQVLSTHSWHVSFLLKITTSPTLGANVVASARTLVKAVRACCLGTMERIGSLMTIVKWQYQGLVLIGTLLVLTVDPYHCHDLWKWQGLGHRQLLKYNDSNCYISITGQKITIIIIIMFY